MKFSERVRDIVFRVNAMSLRERAMILVASVLLVALITDTLFSAPVRKDAAVVERQNRNIEEEIKGLEASITELAAAYEADPDLAAREALERTQQAIRELDARLGAATNELVEPRQMIAALRDVLASRDGLQVDSLRSIGSEPVIHATTEGDEGAATDAAQIYRHRVQLVLRGSYLDVLEYLKQVESTDWKFFWERIDVAVTRYPEVRAEIVVYTLGLKRGWVGV